MPNSTRELIRYLETLAIAHDVPRSDDDGKARWLLTDVVRQRSWEFGVPAPLRPEAPPLQAAVDGSSLVSFVDGLGRDEKDDVLYSLQLAQRGASAAFDRFRETEHWYGKYTEILERVGWTVEQFAFARHDQAEGELRMDQAALAIIAAIATQNQLAILSKSLEALAALAEDDGTIRLFDFHSEAEAAGNFQIGAVQKADNGALGLALGAFRFRSNDRRRRFLFWSWGEQEVEFWTAAQRLTLNPAQYADYRDLVRGKLGLTAKDYLAELKIA